MPYIPLSFVIQSMHLKALKSPKAKDAKSVRVIAFAVLVVG